MKNLVKFAEHEGQYRTVRLERAQKLISGVVQMQKCDVRFPHHIMLVRNGYTNTVILSAKLRKVFCTCKDFQKHRKICKHLYAGLIVLRSEGNALVQEMCRQPYFTEFVTADALVEGTEAGP